MTMYICEQCGEIYEHEYLNDGTCARCGSKVTVKNSNNKVLWLTKYVAYLATGFTESFDEYTIPLNNGEQTKFMGKLIGKLIKIIALNIVKIIMLVIFLPVVILVGGVYLFIELFTEIFNDWSYIVSLIRAIYYIKNLNAR